MKYKNNVLWICLLAITTVVLFQQCDTGIQSGNEHGDSTAHIMLKAMRGLRYDVVRFTVKPGANVKVTLMNTGDMDHNLVFTKPGKRKAVVESALQLGAKGPEMHYVPNSSNVLWHISTLKPGDSQTLTFTAPNKKGTYPYVCTYPGHGVTMYGVMYVTNKQLPPLEEDLNIPQANRKQKHTRIQKTEKEHLHPYKVVPPYVVRTFMPECGPAAIAVSLPDSLSYCWDAGSCRLRYAWIGGFLDHADLWQRKGDEVAQIAGTVFFKDKTKYPFRIGNNGNIPEVSFKGYRLINRYPEFHYQWNGIDVYELIKPKSDGPGLIRIFRIPDAPWPIWFLKMDSGNVKISASAGKWHKSKLQLTPDEARHFTISITKGETNSL